MLSARAWLAALVGIAACVCVARAQDGSGPFPGVIQSKIGSQSVTLDLTGAAVRKKGIFSVYWVGSYLEQGAKVGSAEDLAAADKAKQLHLIMLRRVSGPEMAAAFVSLLRQNHPAPKFAEESAKLAQLLQNSTAQRGDQIWLTHIPKVGLFCRRAGQEGFLIANVEFSKAVWENYLGRYNVGESVKRGLVERLTN